LSVEEIPVCSLVGVHCACYCYFFVNSSSASPTEEKTSTVTPLQDPKQDSTGWSKSVCAPDDYKTESFK